jgi:hypothetical protein
MMAGMGLSILAAWQRAGRPVEFNLYETGGHGFGAERRGTSSDQWFDDFLNWMRARGPLTRP